MSTKHHVTHGYVTHSFSSWMSNLASEFGQIGINGTNLGLFKISFSTFWLAKCDIPTSEAGHFNQVVEPELTLANHNSPSTKVNLGR